MSSSCNQIVRRLIKTPKAGPVFGPYNQAVLVDKTLYMSGCLGCDESGTLVSGGISDETRQALKNIGTLLAEVGATHKNVVKSTCLLADINDFAAFNSVYQEFFTSHHPARSTFQVAALPKGAKVEIECIAVVGDIKEEASPQL